MIQIFNDISEETKKQIKFFVDVAAYGHADTMQIAKNLIDYRKQLHTLEEQQYLDFYIAYRAMKGK